MISITDGARWSLDQDKILLTNYFNGWLNSLSPFNKFRASVFPLVYFVSRDSLFKFPYKYLPRFMPFALDYYHGDPFSDDKYKQYSRFLLSLYSRKKIPSFGIRVSNKSMFHKFQSSILGDFTYCIPIPIDTQLFSPCSSEYKYFYRRSLSISDREFVVGSFQKDGVGWQSGLDPKLIKGPDLFVKAILHLSTISSRPITVLLTGPSRGYVINNLRENDIRVLHFYPDDFRQLPPFYHALDAYLVSSREEGGPKAVLESMASGIPLVSTAVGQAPDVLCHGHNGYLTSLDPIEMAQCLLSIQHNDDIDQLTSNAYFSASRYSNKMMQPLWNTLFNSLIFRS
ncbi:glycosyl transferases group 1 family protein [Synechococcus sp. MIT S9220]|nr:glycosyl transferases group 1 family protein [Synechococcus sp. MIT S9220]